MINWVSTSGEHFLVDDQDADVEHLYGKEWISAKDLRDVIAQRKHLPDYTGLMSVDGVVGNCQRCNIEAGRRDGCRQESSLLSRGGMAVGDRVAQLSGDDLYHITQWTWRVVGGYVVRDAIVPVLLDRKRCCRRIYLHRVIAERMGLDMSKRIFFQDGDSMNCRRDNLVQTRKGCTKGVRITKDIKARMAVLLAQQEEWQPIGASA